jgi:hypothetical protein
MPALLADIGGVFAVIFLLISFIGWIINMINAQNPPPAPNRGPQRLPRARDRKVQNEIEQFLQEAMGNKQAARDEVPADEIEVVEVAPQRRPPPQPQRRPVRAAAPTPQRPLVESSPPERPRPAGGATSRPFTPSTLGSSVASHVKDHMRERVTQETSQHLPHAVNQNVTQHLGEFLAGSRDHRHGVRPVFRSHANVPDPTGLIAELRTSGGMRKAIVLQEILARPRVLRK